MPNTEGYIEPGKQRAKKHIDVELWGLWGKDKASPLKPEVPALPQHYAAAFTASLPRKLLL